MRTVFFIQLNVPSIKTSIIIMSNVKYVITKVVWATVVIYALS